MAEDQLSTCTATLDLVLREWTVGILWALLLTSHAFPHQPGYGELQPLQVSLQPVIFIHTELFVQNNSFPNNKCNLTTYAPPKDIKLFAPFIYKLPLSFFLMATVIVYTIQYSKNTEIGNGRNKKI